MQNESDVKLTPNATPDLHGLNLVDMNQKDAQGRTRLHAAVEKRSPTEVKALLQAGASPYVTDDSGYSSLALALTFQYLDVVECMFDHGVSIYRDEEPALSYAMETGNLQLIKLIQRYFDLRHSRDFCQLNPIDFAIDFGELRLTKYLLTCYPNLEESNCLGMTPLHRAAINGNESITNYLLSLGARIDAPDLEGSTPAFMALLHDQFTLCERLLDFGPQNVNVKFANGDSFLHLAIIQGRVSIAKKLIEMGTEIDSYGTRGTPLLLAIHFDQLEIVRLLLDKGARLEAANRDQNPPLHLAVMVQNLEMVRLLLVNGCNPNEFDQNYYTALHKAVSYEHVSIAELLLQFGADPNVIEPEFRLYPIDIAIDLKNNDRLIELLIAHGATLNHVDDNGSTPLHAAVSACRPRIVSTLLKHRLSPLSRDRLGRCPLHYLLDADSFQVTDVLDILFQLLQAGADIASQDNTGATLLHLAMSRHQPTVIEVLCQRGAPVLVKNVAGYSPLHVAAMIMPSHEFIDKFHQVITILIKNGADPYQLTDHGETPLGLAVSYNSSSASLLAPRYSTSSLFLLLELKKTLLIAVIDDPQHAFQVVLQQLWQREWQRLEASACFTKVLRFANISLFATCKSPVDNSGLPDDTLRSVAKHQLINEPRACYRFLLQSRHFAEDPKPLKRNFSQLS